MTRVLEKTERRLGEKLFLKAHRCSGPKCAHIRRAYPPGVHGKKKSRRRGASEYGQLLHEKQVIRFLYGLDDKDLRRYSTKASSKSGVFGSNFLQMLERRLDNTVFRLGFTESRRIARQIVSHGHVLVGGRPVNIPSYQVKVGDIVSLKENLLSSPLFEGFDARIKNYEPPQWLALDRSIKKGAVVRMPQAEDARVTVDVTKVKEFYSR